MDESGLGQNEAGNVVVSNTNPITAGVETSNANVYGQSDFRFRFGHPEDVRKICFREIPIG